MTADDLKHVTICRTVRTLAVGDIVSVTLGNATQGTLHVVKSDGHLGYAFTRDAEDNASGTLTVWGNDNHTTYRVAGKGHDEQIVQHLQRTEPK